MSVDGFVNGLKKPVAEASTEPAGFGSVSGVGVACVRLGAARVIVVLVRVSAVAGRRRRP